MKGRQSVFFPLDFASFLFLIKKSENLPAHSNVLFFCTACWLSSDFSLCLLFFLWRQSPVSQWGMINSKLQTAFDFIVLKFSKPSFLFSTVFFLVQPGKKYNWFFFFLHFVIYLVPVHSGSILPSVLPMSPLFFLSPFHFDSLCVSSASVQSF